jgi:hypothetical protein
MRNSLSIIVSAAICVAATPSRAGETADASDTEG